MPVMRNSSAFRQHFLDWQILRPAMEACFAECSPKRESRDAIGKPTAQPSIKLPRLAGSALFETGWPSSRGRWRPDSVKTCSPNVNNCGLRIADCGLTVHQGLGLSSRGQVITTSL